MWIKYVRSVYFFDIKNVKENKKKYMMKGVIVVRHSFTQ